MKTSGKTVMVVLCAVALISANTCKKPTAPSVATLAVNEISHYSAVLSGEITSDGGSGITARGFFWALHANPRLTDSKFEDESTDTGIFSFELTELDSQTTYYARAYATNEEGTSLGDVVSFTTGELSEYLITRMQIKQIYESFGETDENTFALSFMYDKYFRMAKLSYEDLGLRACKKFFYDVNGRILRIEDHLNNEYSYFQYSWSGNQATARLYNFENGIPKESDMRLVFVMNTDNETQKVELYYKYGNLWTRIIYIDFFYEDNNLKEMVYYVNPNWRSDDIPMVSGLLRGNNIWHAILKRAPVSGSADDGFYCFFIKTLNHDAFNNPFFPHGVLRLQGISDEESELFFSKNNLLGCLTIHYPGTENHYEQMRLVEYEYNSHGYPMKRSIHQLGEHHKYSQILEFTYSPD